MFTEGNAGATPDVPPSCEGLEAALSVGDERADDVAAVGREAVVRAGGA